jgi:cobalt-zinc-cadmium efflux system protein
MSHTHHTGNASGEKSHIGLAFFLNLAFAFIELVGGFMTNSVAILSDAVHDMGDSLSLALAWYFQKLSRRGRSVRYTYGYKRFSLLGAIINSIVLVAGSAYIISEAVPRLFSPEPTDAKGMFLLAILGIIINGVAVLRTRKANSMNERVVSLHLLEDVLGWAAVLVGSAVMHLTGWMVIDPVLSLLVACFVIVNVVKNVRRIMPILLQGTPADIDQERIAGALTAIDGVSAVHDLHVWSLDESYTILTAHLVLGQSRALEQLHDLRRTVRGALRAQGIQHATIEFEMPGAGCDYEDSI